MYDVEKIENILKDKLSEFRYEHSLMVAKEAKKLAKYYRYNEEKAYIAGLVHDIAKEFSTEETNRWIKKYNLSEEWLLPEFRNIVHAEIGSVVVKEYYQLDKDICNSVKYHAIGDISMNLLDKIVFVADKIARNKITPEIEEERLLAYQNIDQALALCLTNQKEKLENKGQKLHPNSLKLLENLTIKNI